MQQPKILIIDLGSQYTLIIGRIIRELGFRSVIFSPSKANTWLACHRPKAIILSGGSASVYEENAPQVPEKVLKMKVPILAVCYGMQWIAQKLSGEVSKEIKHKKYGSARVILDTADKLFFGIKKRASVWASHGDSVARAPKGFQIIGRYAAAKTIVAMSCPRKKIWCLQFHPEVTHTQDGRKILRNFLADISRCKKDWIPFETISEIQKEVKEISEKNKKFIIGFSGGVDSVTLSAVLSPVLGKNLLALTINTGALRSGELDEIRKSARVAGVNLKIVEASGRFQKALGKTTDAEIKRRRFKKLYGKILEQAAKDFGADFIVQGSLATDLIESGQVGQATLIKSHHNVGLNLKIKELHPFRHIFKYEVRDLARVLNLPRSVSERQPFPGPGLFLRVRGASSRPDKLALVRWADKKITNIMKRHKIYNEVSQLIVALNCTKAVGIKGDGRVYGYTVDVRAVQTSDFMTAQGYYFPEKVAREICSEITRHPKIVHTAFYPSDKPPATTEFE